MLPAPLPTPNTTKQHEHNTSTHTHTHIHAHTRTHAQTGKLTDTRQRFLGTRPPRLFPVSVRGGRALLALSSRPWLGYSDMGRWQVMPLSYEALDYAAVRAVCVCVCVCVALSYEALDYAAVRAVCVCV